MAHAALSIEELRSMQYAELLRERATKRMTVARMRIEIELKKEKDSAAYRRGKKELARMETVLGEKQPKKPTDTLPRS